MNLQQRMFTIVSDKSACSLNPDYKIVSVEWRENIHLCKDQIVTLLLFWSISWLSFKWQNPKITLFFVNSSWPFTAPTINENLNF